MKLIMVDLDGTLLDTKDVNYYAYKETLESFGYSLDYDYFCKYCNGRYFMEFLPQITTNDKEMLENIHNQKKANYKKYLNYARLNFNLVSLLNECKKEYKVALVTTASRENTNQILNEANINNLFDLVLTREDIIKNKPDPEGFIKAMKHFDSKPEECIIFEDSKMGVEAAEKTGSLVCVVRGFN